MKSAALFRQKTGLSENSTKATPFFQAKLTVNQPGDSYEQEADAVADRVMRMPDATPPQAMPFRKVSVADLQRKCAACEEEEHVQRKDRGGGGQTAPATVSNVIAGSGHPLDSSTRQFMENRMGQDFSQVQIHTDGQAADSSQAINALAYTSGKHIVFNSGQYQPHSESGKRLLAHELVHVGQQGGGIKSVQRAVAPSKVSCNSYSRSFPIFTWMGTTDPVAVIQETDARAIGLLTLAIDTLEFHMAAIRNGAAPAVPTFSDCTAESIATRLLINPENAQSWTGTGTGSISHFLKWLKNLRRTFESGGVRYNCRGPLCEPTYGAYIMPGQGFLVNLCSQFWLSTDVDVRALQLIHELAHVYYDTGDSGRGAGSSYCIHGIVADLNNLHSTMSGFENCGGQAMQSC